MLLHTVEIAAFGPFAEPVRVDFDSLSEANVFLLCGDTGAGKTTVLDAVCFGLYGDLPSNRSAAKQLKSQHSAPDARPRVVVEATIGGHRYRFTRSPQWRRPKKRGTGLTTEQARVLVEQRRGESWELRTNRLDEAGQLIGDLLGMTLAQFSQVALLPQGDFDRFLHASSEERHQVLAHLFRTGRFEDVERWLVEQRTSLRRASERQGAEVQELLHRFSETAAVPLPDAWHTMGPHGPAPRADSSTDSSAVEPPRLDPSEGLAELDAWASEHLDAAAQTHAGAQARLRAATAARAGAEDDLATGRRLVEEQRRWSQAQLRQGTLAENAAQAAEDEDRLRAAERARPVLPLIRLCDSAQAAATSSRRRTESALADLGDELDIAVAGFGPEDAQRLDAGATAASERAAVARSFLPRARRLSELVDRLAQLDSRILDLEAELHQSSLQVDDVDNRLQQTESALEVIDADCAGLPEAEQRVREQQHLGVLSGRAERLRAQVAESERDRDTQRTAVLDLRERLVQVRERRMLGMAAELATQLAVGADCPVCGSTEHPAPADPDPQAATGEDERELQAQIDDAEIALVARQDAWRGHTAQLDVVLADLGDHDPSSLPAALADATAERDRLTALREESHRLRRRVSALREEQAGATGKRHRLEAGLIVAREQHDSAVSEHHTLTAELAGLLDEERAGGPDDVAALVRRHEASARTLVTARNALAEHLNRTEQAAAAADAAEAAAAEHGFETSRAAHEAALDPDVVAELREQAECRRREARTVAEALADPSLARAGATTAPDLDALESRVARTEADHDQAVSNARFLQDRHRRLGRHHARLTAARDRWRPILEEYGLVRAVSEFAEGKGPENPRQMRLSAYVLAARLTQVVAAANERLRRMSDERFALEHTSDRGVGERRGGLSLLVRDHWTDEVRDPVTLSGGESFVVSLALALGLADVVTGESGGTRIDTLFVDEGFGSLDSDTLESVMDTLDQLREGGRVVGIVSHVSELRSRIPTQLVVHKTRDGSRVEQRHGAG